MLSFIACTNSLAKNLSLTEKCYILNVDIMTVIMVVNIAAYTYIIHDIEALNIILYYIFAYLYFEITKETLNRYFKVSS